MRRLFLMLSRGSCLATCPHPTPTGHIAPTLQPACPPPSPAAHHPPAVQTVPLVESRQLLGHMPLIRLGKGAVHTAAKQQQQRA